MRFILGVFLRGSVVVAFAVIILTLSTKSQAVELGWVEHPSIKFTVIKEFSGIAERPTTTYGANTTCSKRSIMTKPPAVRLMLPDTPATYTEDCMNDAVYGAIGGGSFIKPNVGIAGPITLRSNKEFLANGPNLSTGVIFDATAPTGVYVNFAPNISSQIDINVQTDKTVRYALRPGADVTNLKNSKNERLSAMTETVAFSSNGDWVFFDSPYYGLVRLNTKDGSILPFGSPTNYANNPFYQMAISADGRYAVVSASNTFRIYDLQSCVSQTGSLSYLMNCKARSLEDQRAKDANYGRYPAYIRFANQDSFTYYAAQLVNGVNVYRQYRVTMGDVPQLGFEYLGLGDSFASGEGAFSYKAFSQGKCHLSLSSYPYLIGGQLSKEKYESVACSGAKNEDILNNFPDKYDGQYKDKIPEENRDIEEILRSFFPGYIRQSTFISGLNPEAITISIGGNDMAFGDKVKNCVFNLELDQTCFNTLEDRKEIAEEVYSLVPTLIPTYEKLKENNRRVYVVGYPKIVKPDGNCANNVKMNASELAFADKLTTLINDAIEFATGQAGVSYVDVENILEDRRLCETNSDNTLVHGITQKSFGVGGEDIIATESFHPKSDAHKLYRDAILSQTSKLSKKMPIPNALANMPRLATTDAFFRDLATSGRTIYKPIYQDFVPGSVYINSRQIFELRGQSIGLGPLAQLSAEIHSTPVSLGNFTADANGDTKAEITIPGNVKPGYHSLHFFGTNQAGQKIDVYDYVFVGVSESDFDGDGVPNEDEGCVYVTTSGGDTDQDKVDDACDGVVDPLPLPPPPPPATEPEPIVEEQPTPEPEPEPEIQPAVDPTAIDPEELIIVGPTPELPPIDIPQNPPEEEVVPLPEITPIEPPKDIDGNGETVAGNEEMVTPEPEVAQTPTTNPTPTRTNTNVRNVVVAVSNPEPTSEVLGTTDATETSPPAVTQKPSSVKDKPAPVVVKDTKVYKYYLLAGVLAFVALVTFLLVAMKKQKR
jgi:GDSL-like Lipase/Acylhydrolase family